MGVNPIWLFSLKKEKFGPETDIPGKKVMWRYTGRIPREGEDRDESDASISHGESKIACKPLDAGERPSASQLLTRSNPSDI